MPEKCKLLKVVRRGCKRSFGPREQEAFCIGAKWGYTGAKDGLGGTKDSLETFAPWAQKSQKDLLHPLLTTFGNFPFLGFLPGPQHPKHIFWVAYFLLIWGVGVVKIVLALLVLVDVSDLFYLFLVGEGEGGVRGARKGGGIGFQLKIPGQGGGARRGGG